MAKRRARENPLKTRDKLLIGGGAATLLGLTIFFLTRPKDEKKGSGSSANKGSPQNGIQPGTVLSTPKDSAAVAPPPPPPPSVTTASPSVQPMSFINTPNVSWVPGPNP